MNLQLRRHPGKDHIIRVIDPAGKDFGTVDVKTSFRLAKIMDNLNPKYRTQAKLILRPRKPDEYPGKLCSEYLKMSINLYGPKSKAKMVGNWLSQSQIILRTPLSSDAGIEIFNPHEPSKVLPRTTNTYGTSSGSGSGSIVSRTVEEVRSDVIGMFDNLQNSETLPAMEADIRITTELLTHQKQGLVSSICSYFVSLQNANSLQYFLVNKEKARVFGEKEEDNNSLWRLKLRSNGRRSYYNVITGHEEAVKPPEVLGGILADMMGLGKTLTILSLIVGSLDEADVWGEQPAPANDGEKRLIRNSKTTLLVAPLSTVANWEEQIGNHIRKDTLNVCIYHGANRTTDIQELAKYDVVITTYSIVSSEFSGRGNRKLDNNPLLQTNFFRIVLDEAHMIREQSTR